jgi:hypothetical protein
MFEAYHDRGGLKIILLNFPADARKIAKKREQIHRPAASLLPNNGTPGRSGVLNLTNVAGLMALYGHGRIASGDLARRGPK